MIKSILFDLDGTLCDCAELHYESLNKALFETVGIKISREEHISRFNGLPTKTKLKILGNLVKPEDHQNIFDLKQKYTIEMINTVLHEEKEKIEMHEYLKSLNIKLACVTNSINKTASLILEKTGQLKYLDLLVSNDMIRYPKPHPEGWIVGMVSLNSLPIETLIVEDSPVGFESAKSSGANIYKINNSYELTIDNIKKYII